MKKSKFLKAFGFSSLALLMGIAGTMAFAPLGASPSVAGASEMIKSTTTSGLGLDPKNDPVIYTTESGLEIKYGNTASSIVNNSLGSGNLAGFPYFTTSSGSTTYTWVIIGRNSDTTIFANSITSHLFSSWKSTHNKSGGLFNTNGYYFFNNAYENSTPAGNAIDSSVSSKSYVNDLLVNSYALKTSTEIPSGCVLVLAEKILFTATYSNSGNGLTDTQIENLNLPSNVLDYIKSVNIQCYTGWTSPTYYYADFRFFYLSNNYQFRHATYLTSAALKIAYNSTGTASSWWLRDHNSGATRQSVTATGGTANSNGTCGVRPAFCLKIT